MVIYGRSFSLKIFSLLTDGSTDGPAGPPERTRDLQRHGLGAPLGPTPELRSRTGSSVRRRELTVTRSLRFATSGDTPGHSASTISSPEKARPGRVSSLKSERLFCPSHSRRSMGSSPRRTRYSPNGSIFRRATSITLDHEAAQLAFPVTFRFRGLHKDASVFSAENDMISISYRGHAVACRFVRRVAA